MRLYTKEFLYVISFWKLPQVTFVSRSSLALQCGFLKAVCAFSSDFNCLENSSINPIYKGKEDRNVAYAKSEVVIEKMYVAVSSVAFLFFCGIALVCKCK